MYFVLRYVCYVRESRNNVHGELILKMIHENILYELRYHQREQMQQNAKFGAEKCIIIYFYELIMIS